MKNPVLKSIASSCETNQVNTKNSYQENSKYEVFIHPLPKEVKERIDKENPYNSEAIQSYVPGMHRCLTCQTCISGLDNIFEHIIGKAHTVRLGQMSIQIALRVFNKMWGEIPKMYQVNKLITFPSSQNSILCDLCFTEINFQNPCDTVSHLKKHMNMPGYLALVAKFKLCKLYKKPRKEKLISPTVAGRVKERHRNRKKDSVTGLNGPEDGSSDSLASGSICHSTNIIEDIAICTNMLENKLVIENENHKKSVENNKKDVSKNVNPDTSNQSSTDHAQENQPLNQIIPELEKQVRNDVLLLVFTKEEITSMNESQKDYSYQQIQIGQQKHNMQMNCQTSSSNSEMSTVTPDVWTGIDSKDMYNQKVISTKSTDRLYCTICKLGIPKIVKEYIMHIITSNSPHQSRQQQEIGRMGRSL